MKLHEIELFSSDPEASSKIFSSVLGLQTNVDQPELKVFNTGTPGIDLNVSSHYSSAKVSLSFLVKDIIAFKEMMQQKNVEVGEISDSHLGLKSVTLADNFLCRIVIHSPTSASPQWLQNMV